MSRLSVRAHLSPKPAPRRRTRWPSCAWTGWPCRPRWTGADARAAARRAGPTVTDKGIGAEEAIRLWEQVLAPACLSVDHPRYLSFIPGAPTKASAAFDMLVGASSVYAGTWLEGSGAVYAENQALRWIADLVGMPEEAGGVFVQGGTIGNLSALVAAREAAKYPSGRTGRPAGRWWSPTRRTPRLSTRCEVVMDVDVVHRARRRARPADRSRHPGPAGGAARGRGGRHLRGGRLRAGTTNSGVIDDLAGIAEVARERGWWFHVDGAYGGAGLAAPSVRDRFAGVEHADSFIVDPHKWLFAPYDCCALVYRDPVLARAAHTQKAGYLDPVTVEGEWNPSDFSVQLTRRARGLPFWFSLAVHGTDAYAEAVEQTLAGGAGRQGTHRRRRARPAAGRAGPVGADLRTDRLAGRRLRPLDGPDAGRRASPS